MAVDAAEARRRLGWWPAYMAAYGRATPAARARVDQLVKDYNAGRLEPADFQRAVQRALAILVLLEDR